MRSILRCLHTLSVRSLAEATRESKRLKVLDLTGSQDLLCMNLMCEKVGTPCICRLSLCLERLTAVEVLILANNNLSDIPSSLWKLTSLLEVDLSRNCLHRLPPEIQQLQNLQVLKVVHNPSLKALPEEIQSLTGLRELHVDKALLPAVTSMVLPHDCKTIIQ